jgi:hypothetical protein
MAETFGPEHHKGPIPVSEINWSEMQRRLDDGRKKVTRALQDGDNLSGGAKALLSGFLEGESIDDEILYELGEEERQRILELIPVQLHP